MMVDSDLLRSARELAPSRMRLTVVMPMRTELKAGDEVTMVADRATDNWFFRASDDTIHPIHDKEDQYLIVAVPKQP